MSETAPSEPQAQAAVGSPKRKGPPAWGIVLFLALLGGLVVVNHVVSSSGPEIKWIENDLDTALKQVSDTKRRVFLYLYEPQDETHKRNELQVFTQRWAREPLAKLVCCRIALRPDNRESAKLRQEFNYKGTPLFLLLTRDRTPVSRTEGAVTEGQFYANITDPSQRSQKVDEGGKH